jgi:hypothetical protein
LRGLHLETLAVGPAAGKARQSPHHPRRDLLLLQSTNIQLKRALLAQQGQSSKANAQYQALLEEVLDVRKVVEAVAHNIQQPLPVPAKSKSSATPSSSSSSSLAAAARPDGNVAALQSVCTVLARATRRATPRPSTSAIVEGTSTVAGGASSPSVQFQGGPSNPAMLLLADFIAQPRGSEVQPVHLADLCSGSLNHLNVGQVGRLEGVLWSLNARLHALQATLGTAFLPHTLPGFRERSATLLQGCQAGLEEACASLLSLSVLLPAAPLPALPQVRGLGGVTIGPDPGEEAQLLLARMPSLSASTRSKLEGMVAGLVKLVLSSRVSGCGDAWGCMDVVPILVLGPGA